VYMPPYYYTLGTPYLHTVWHGQRTRRRSSVCDKALGSKEEKPVGERLS